MKRSRSYQTRRLLTYRIISRQANNTAWEILLRCRFGDFLELAIQHSKEELMIYLVPVCAQIFVRQKEPAVTEAV